MKLIVKFNSFKLLIVFRIFSTFFLSLTFCSFFFSFLHYSSFVQTLKIAKKTMRQLCFQWNSRVCGLSSNLALFDCSTLHSSLSLSVFRLLSFFFFVQIVRFLLAASWKFNKFSPSPMNVAFNAYSSLTRLSLRLSMFYFLAFLLSLLMLSFISFN